MSDPEKAAEALRGKFTHTDVMISVVTKLQSQLVAANEKIESLIESFKPTSYKALYANVIRLRCEKADLLLELAVAKQEIEQIKQVEFPRKIEIVIAAIVRERDQLRAEVAALQAQLKEAGK